MHINDLELFIAVAKLGSFSKAAESLDTRRALVSRRIAELEKHLGAPLFIRTTRAMSLTPNGEQFLMQVEPLVDQLRNAAHIMRNQQAQVQGKVRIGLIPYTDKLLHHHIAEFVHQYPQVQLDIFMINGGYKEMTRLGLDFMLDAGELNDSSFIAKKLKTFNLQLFASPDYLIKKPKINTIEDLSQQVYIGRREVDGSLETQILLNNQPVDLNYSIITTELNSILSFCSAGAGIAILPYSIVADEVDAGKLVNVLPELKSAPFDCYLVYPSRKHLSSAAKMFANKIIEMADALTETEVKRTQQKE
ncbi:LysR family transcriptional regulator [Shewanella sp. 10N.7]|uniref:LysR family transcriptional regulator n=1 Tax=Shewanella sp. 10N.7 TaxID=2885093 RepID=UPI001E3A6BCD|nr:LysR family transcriptional regulator [Shewanella sp. 10N.7]MCC4834943.1 LysR family transcriptional regulator [Shewanella sp. 10N.7]